MKTQEEKIKEFETLAKPLMEWLDTNYNPHTTIILTSSDAELVQGEMAITRKVFD